MARYRYVVCDVFTNEPLAGNQLAVFTDARGIPEEQLQPLAKEMNFSETAFVYPPNGRRARRDADLHAVDRASVRRTPDARHGVRARGPAAADRDRIETGRGTVPVTVEREGARIVFGRMAQPLPTIAPFEQVGRAARSARRRRVGDAGRGVRQRSSRTCTSRSRSRDEVVALEPDMQRLGELGAYGINCFAGDGHELEDADVRLGLGMAEDPATGSAAGPLALHLARHGRIAFGDEIEISQGAEIGRPSTLYARVDGTADAIERIEVGGSAVIVARGEFSI